MRAHERALGGRPEPRTLTSDNQMTRKPDLGPNAEIESSGRAANSATTTARDPEIIDPITAFVGHDAPVHQGGHRQCRDSKFLPTVAECVKWLERNTETLRSGAAWDKRSREQLADRNRWEHSAKEEPLEVRQAVAERIKAELTAYGFKFPGCDL